MGADVYGTTFCSHRDEKKGRQEPTEWNEHLMQVQEGHWGKGEERGI